jgi:N-acyl-D-amino-acid deacylase
VDDLVIAGGTVVDGSGASGFSGTVTVRGGRVSAVLRDGSGPSSVEATHRLDASGLIVAPGFIDVHTHSDLGPLVDPAMPSTVRQGVTTIVVGNCGSSPWPNAGARECAQMAGAEPDPAILRFRSFGEYLERIEWARPAVNVGALVGHGAVRLEAMGGERRQPTADEIRPMRRSIAAAMDDGAFGMSTGLIYVPGLYAQTDEIVELAREAANAGGLHASHIRGEGEHLFRAVDEAVEIGRRAGVPVHISHLKCEGASTWGRTDELLGRVHGRDDVSADQYPYSAWASVLWSFLPAWASATSLRAIAATADRRLVLVRAIEDGEGEAFQSSVRGVGWDRIVIESSGDGAWNGRSIASIADSRGVEPVDACLDLLLSDPDTACIGHAMDEHDVRGIVADPEVMVASDGVSMSPSGPFASMPVHPRNYGTFPRVVGHYVRDGALTLEAAIRKMTSLPADRFGLRDRGRLVQGGAADLVVFDPADIGDRSTFEEPHIYPGGIHAVIVNGEMAWRAGRGDEDIRRAGMVLRRT